MEGSIDVLISGLKRKTPLEDEDEKIRIISIFVYLFPDSRNLEAALDLFDKVKLG